MTSVSKALVIAFLLSPALSAADSALTFSRTLGGKSGSTVINVIATDPSGNIVVAGTTSAFDFPVTSGSSNSGTQIAESLDSGNTWKPLSNLPSGSAYVLAVDASTPPLLFAGGTSGVFRSADGGKSWAPTAAVAALNCTVGSPFCGITALAADPVNPRTVYVGGFFGIFKTTDGGATWQTAQSGLNLSTGTPVYYITIDPFHPRVLCAAVGFTDFRSSDGGVSWSQYSVPNTNPDYHSGSSISFDPFTEGRVYHSGPQGMYISSDGGQTWIQPSSLTVPLESVAASPAAAGVAYAFDWNGKFFGSKDGGATWSLISSRGYSSRTIRLDPFQPSHIIAGNVSTDGGITWSPLSLGRAANQILFDPQTPGQLWAETDPTSDAFVAKLDPSGQQILFATYFGGPGNDSVSKMGLDGSGNIYIMGFTSATGFPVTPGAVLPALSNPPSTPTYVAKFDSSVNLVYATYTDEIAFGFGVSPDGSVVLTGFQCRVEKISPDGSQFLFSETLSANSGCDAAAVGADGTIVVGGRDGSKTFPVTADALQSAPIGSQDAVLAKLDSSGALLYATYLGGSAPAGTSFGSGTSFDGRGTSHISAIAIDSQGNIVLAGSTGADFPVTPGAYQSSLDAQCPYPSSAVATGLIGTIVTRRMDDVFVTRLDPSGATILSSTLLGGACYDQVDSIDVDANGNVWLAGLTNSNPFPQVVPFATGPSYADYKGYVAEFDSGGDRLLLSSYINAGGSPVVAVDRTGGAWVAGTTSPAPPEFTFPAPPALPTPGAGFLAHIGPVPANPMVITAIGNSYTGRNGPLAPGELATISLAGFNPDQPADLGYTSNLPTTLAGAQVLFDGEPAALAAVVPGTIFCVTPYDLVDKTSTTIQVKFNGQVSTAIVADVVTADIGLLSADGSGQGQAYARNEDGTLNSPDNPAKAGSTVTFYVTGLGSPDSACPYGQIDSVSLIPQQTVRAALAGPQQISSLQGFVCGIYSVQGQAPAFNTPVPNAYISVAIADLPARPVQQNSGITQTLTFAVTP